MGAQVPLVMALDDAGAVPRVAGGKGASLARLAWERLARRDPRKAATARKLIARWAPVARDREAARSELVRSVWVARAWMTGQGQRR